MYQLVPPCHAWFGCRDTAINTNYTSINFFNNITFCNIIFLFAVIPTYIIIIKITNYIEHLFCIKTWSLRPLDFTLLNL